MIDSIIGVNTKLVGNFEINSSLRIDGIFEGSIKGNAKILVGETGSAFFDIEASDIVVGGEVQGNLIIKGKATILSTGCFKGKLKAHSIELNPGAQFQGQCSILKKDG